MAMFQRVCLGSVLTGFLVLIGAAAMSFAIR
jgi:hypothetical protein